MRLLPVLASLVLCDFTKFKSGISNNNNIVAYGDFNSDRFVDVFTLDKDRTTVSVYAWKPQELPKITQGIFYLLTQIIPSQIGCPVTAIIPSDFTFNGKMDLLVVCDKENGKHRNILFFQENGVLGKKEELEPTTTVLTLVDFDGNLHSSLIGRIDDETVVFSFAEGKMKKTGVTGFCKIAEHHSNATLDMNGDCLTDLVLTCEDNEGLSLNIFKNSVSGFSESPVTVKLPEGSGIASFVDFDGDGNVDIVFHVCWPALTCTEKNELQILYNKNSPIKKKGQVCKQDSLEYLPPQIIKLSSVFNDNGIRLQFMNAFIPNQLNSLKFGDYDLDSYPDLLVSTTSNTIYLLTNTECTLSNCDAVHVNRESRTLSLETVGSIEKGKFPTSDAYMASFLDFSKSGRLDLIMNLTGSPISVKAFQNTITNDYFMIKGLSLNGACSESICNDKKLVYQGQGVNYPGATFFVVAQDRKDEILIRMGSQLVQSGVMTLQLPRSVIGLGRVDNVIPAFYCGVSKRMNVPYLESEFLIPNSDLIITPPAGNRDWKIALYIDPGEYSLWVFITAVCSMIACVVIAIILKRREAIEDRQEKRNARHIINFDAL